MTESTLTTGSRDTPGDRLRRSLAAEQPLQVAGVINAYCAMLAQRAGFQALYLSGAGVANASLGIPDLGLTRLDAVLEKVGVEEEEELVLIEEIAAVRAINGGEEAAASQIHRGCQIADCETCARNTMAKKPKGRAHVDGDVREFNDKVSSDDCGPSTVSIRGNVHYSAAIDHKTRWREAEPIQKKSMN